MKNRVMLFFIFVFLAIANCSKETNPERNEVIIENKFFNPKTLIIPVNTTVTWRNRDGMDHTVTSEDDLFDSGKIRDNGTFSTDFKIPGTYRYYCLLHPEMKGVVVVKSLSDTIPPTVY